MAERKMSKKEEENLWNALLSEALTSNKFYNSNILLLGDKNSGKRSLLNALQELSETEIPSKKNETNKLGMKGVSSVLEYIYLDVKNLNDPDNETMAKLNIYLMDDIKQKDILDTILTEEFVKSLMLILCIDFAEPWRFIQSLNEWLDVLTSKISKMKISLKTQDEMRAKILDYILNFKEPVFEEDGKLVKNTAKKEDNPDSGIENLKKQTMELKEGVLKVNYGIPIIIVVNKSDLIENLERDKDGDKKMDYINYNLRSLALTYGATLIFVSCKSNLNLDILYEYILHRIYSFDLRFKPELVHKETLFIPSGYDNMNLINTFYQNVDKKLIYEEFITEPITKKGPPKEEVPFEDYQQFLQKLKDKLMASGEIKPSGPGIQVGGLTVTLEKNEPSKTLEPNPQTMQTMSSSTNSETLKKFYDQLISNTPTNNTKPGITTAPGVRSAFDPKSLKEKAERDIMEKINKMNLNTNASKDQKATNKLMDRDSEKILDLLKKTKK